MHSNKQASTSINSNNFACFTNYDLPLAPRFFGAFTGEVTLGGGGGGGDGDGDGDGGRGLLVVLPT